MTETDLREGNLNLVGDFVTPWLSDRAWICGVEGHLNLREFELLTLFIKHREEPTKSRRPRILATPDTQCYFGDRIIPSL